MRAKTPVLYCDGEDSFCGSWDLDYYAQTVSAVNDVPITMDERAPGWSRTEDNEDLCPECTVKHRCETEGHLWGDWINGARSFTGKRWKRCGRELCQQTTTPEPIPTKFPSVGPR